MQVGQELYCVCVHELCVGARVHEFSGDVISRVLPKAITVVKQLLQRGSRHVWLPHFPQRGWCKDHAPCNVPERFRKEPCLGLILFRSNRAWTHARKHRGDRLSKTCRCIVVSILCVSMFSMCDKSGSKFERPVLEGRSPIDASERN